MIRSRFVSIGVLIAMLLMLPLSGFGQTIAMSLEDYNMLKEELLTSKALLANSNLEISALQQSLSEAKQNYANSEQIIVDLNLSLEEAERLRSNLEQRINRLERRLTAAQREQEALQSRIDFLESQLTEVSESLKSTTQQLEENEESHVAEIENLVQGYEHREALLKWGVGIAIGVAVLEAIVIGVQALSR